MIVERLFRVKRPLTPKKPLLYAHLGGKEKLFGNVLQRSGITNIFRECCSSYKLRPSADCARNLDGVRRGILCGEKIPLVSRRHHQGQGKDTILQASKNDSC